MSGASALLQDVEEAVHSRGDFIQIVVLSEDCEGHFLTQLAKLPFTEMPVWNMNKLPKPFLTAIYNDRRLRSGQYLKSQFVVECLQSLGTVNNASGIYFPSRRTDGGMVILNPQIVNIDINFTGQSPPSGLI